MHKHSKRLSHTLILWKKQHLKGGYICHNPCKVRIWAILSNKNCLVEPQDLILFISIQVSWAPNWKLVDLVSTWQEIWVFLYPGHWAACKRMNGALSPMLCADFNLFGPCIWQGHLSTNTAKETRQTKQATQNKLKVFTDIEHIIALHHGQSCWAN